MFIRNGPDAHNTATATAMPTANPLQMQLISF